MSAAELLMDLERLGIQLEANGERLRFQPRSAVTPSLLERLEAHKAELLAMLRTDSEAPNVDRNSAQTVWQAALRSLNGDPLFPPDVMDALRVAEVRWVNGTENGNLAPEPAYEPLATDGSPVNRVVPNDRVPCPFLGTHELLPSMPSNSDGRLAAI